MPEDATSPYSISWNTTTAAKRFAHPFGAGARCCRQRDHNNADQRHGRQPSAIAARSHKRRSGGDEQHYGHAVAHRMMPTERKRRDADAVLKHGNDVFDARILCRPNRGRSRTVTAARPCMSNSGTRSGNWSTAATDTIVLDTTAPTISASTATNVTNALRHDHVDDQ